MLIMMIIIVFVAALDLTKAYDRFNQCILILKLYDIGMPKGYCYDVCFLVSAFVCNCCLE